MLVVFFSDPLPTSRIVNTGALDLITIVMKSLKLVILSCFYSLKKEKENSFSDISRRGILPNSIRVILVNQKVMESQVMLVSFGPESGYSLHCNSDVINKVLFGCSKYSTDAMLKANVIHSSMILCCSDFLWQQISMKFFCLFFQVKIVNEKTDGNSSKTWIRTRKKVPTWMPSFLMKSL